MKTFEQYKEMLDILEKNMDSTKGNDYDVLQPQEWIEIGQVMSEIVKEFKNQDNLYNVIKQVDLRDTFCDIGRNDFLNLLKIAVAVSGLKDQQNDKVFNYLMQGESGWADLKYRSLKELIEKEKAENQDEMEAE